MEYDLRDYYTGIIFLNCSVFFCIALLFSFYPVRLFDYVKSINKAVPEVGRKIVHSMWMSVVLPAPFGPSSPKISPLPILRLMLSTTLSDL